MFVIFAMSYDIQNTLSNSTACYALFRKNNVKSFSFAWYGKDEFHSTAPKFRCYNITRIYGEFSGDRKKQIRKLLFDKMSW